jgi:carbonic anhydrase
LKYYCTYSRFLLSRIDEWKETDMSDLPALLERNRNITDAFTHGDLPGRPRLSTVVLACVDARVDPAHIFDLGPGDAVVIRNPGGRITPAVLRDLSILGVLAATWQPELVVIHHTDCGMGRLAKPAIQQQVAKRLGLSVDEVAAMAITDPTTTVRADIERLRHTPGTPDELVVSGLVYDVAAGTVEQVVAPAPLRDRNESTMPSAASRSNAGA